MFRISVADVFSPRVLSLAMSFEGTMVLNAELLSIEIASSVDLLGRYANWSRSRISGIMVLM